MWQPAVKRGTERRHALGQQTSYNQKSSNKLHIIAFTRKGKIQNFESFIK